MKKWIWILAIVSFIIIGFVINIYLNAVEPVKAASSEAETIAKKEADIHTVDNFTLFHGTDKNTYYIVEGKNSKNENMIVWIEEKNHTITVRKQKDGITKKQAINKLLAKRSPAKINTVRLSMIRGIPSWEINTHSDNNLINYYYLDFETGEELLLNIENI
ncbi:cell wall elongation regulator TseB-like domain-containing protein [Niallia sp. 01092]|uniref:cell wall elongation regulator TseB-like domain-containing protein n=1 Tax=unclassified Niallia TaxID=2837522 RepID=UPI003FD18075